jgi:hypothetical protein
MKMYGNGDTAPRVLTIAMNECELRTSRTACFIPLGRIVGGSVTPTEHVGREFHCVDCLEWSPVLWSFIRSSVTVVIDSTRYVVSIIFILYKPYRLVTQIGDLNEMLDLEHSILLTLTYSFLRS